MRLSTIHKSQEHNSDNELIELLCAGEEKALNILMSRYKKRLFAFIYRYVHNEDVAYDILQETFIRLYYKADTYDASYNFSTWLFQIAINLCHDYSRKNKLSNLVSLDEENEGEETYEKVGSHDPDVENIAASRQELKLVSKEIEKLPHKLKTALIIFAVEEHSQEEAAELLGITPKTLEMRVYRARKILSKKLGKII